ncbi:MAG: hypothetical protein B6I38_08530 [Anaerolineaceae bacterium 4572_5.1]|nr:MAG: hypothetical protein B6I38_08530 [Anaerolineaceae bacterium 4572_5.1]
MSNYLRYASPNEAALDFINEEDRNNAGMYPPEDVVAKMFFFADVGTADQFYQDAWDDIIANHGQ